ncbi:MAG: ABC transporter permease [Fusobacteriaceae bacterium]|jgi:peptide/nickel transport system permease protein|nr:ABC transporter permease [Fusobacteriaceae bacterium]
MDEKMLSEERNKKRKILTIGIIIVIILSICVYFYKNPYTMHDNKALAKSSVDSLLGYDNLGRDIFSRLLLGSFFSLSISFISVSLSTIVGTIIGSFAGYYGKYLDSGIVLFTEVLIAIPSILIALGVIVILKAGFASMITAIFLMYLARCINMVRGLVKKEKHMEYVVAAKTYGISKFRIIFIHILPNITKPILINFTTGFAGAILTEAGLGYLGLGIQPPYPTWGNMLNQSQSYFLANPLFTIAPGLAIIITVYYMNKLEKRNKRF